MELIALSRKDLTFVEGRETCLVLPLCEGESLPDPSAIQPEHAAVLQALMEKKILTGKAQ